MSGGSVALLVKACKRGAVRSGASGCQPILRSAMEMYRNPYRDDPELAPLTRSGRVIECLLTVLLAVLAILLSR